MKNTKTEMSETKAVSKLSNEFYLMNSKLGEVRRNEIQRQTSCQIKSVQKKD